MKPLKTATTLDKVIVKELQRLVDEMKSRKGLPSSDLQRWSITSRTQRQMKYAIIKSVEQTHNQCDNWALQIDRILELMK